MNDTTRDTDFTNLQPGDEITQIWTVQPNGWVSGRKDGDSQIRPTAVGDPAVSNLFVSKRQPRPLKPGDKFIFSNGSDTKEVRTIVFMDDKSVLYIKDRTGQRHHVSLKNGVAEYYGNIIHAS